MPSLSERSRDASCLGLDNSERSLNIATAPMARLVPLAKIAVIPASPRRGRPPTIDSEKLLEVAREVFLERGIRATTLEVAERAGVSEGAIFHRFKSKEGLFGAAMRLDQNDVPQLLMKELAGLGELEIQEALIQLATTLLEVGRIALPLMMMSWSNPSLCGATPCDNNRENYRKFIKQLAAFFEGQMNQGTLRRLDAEVVARTFLGSVHHYCMSRLIASDSPGVMIPEGMFVRGLVDLLLNGASPGASPILEPSPRRSRQRR